MKKIILIMMLAAGCLFFVPAFSAPNIGVLPGVGETAGYDTVGTDEFTLSEIIGRYIRYMLGSVGVIFFVLTVYAGILWMTAGGNEEQVSKAQGIIKTGVIGIVVALSAYSITSFVFKSGIVSSPESTSEQPGVQDRPGCCYYKLSAQSADIRCLREPENNCTKSAVGTAIDIGVSDSAWDDLTLVGWYDCPDKDYKACK